MLVKDEADIIGATIRHLLDEIDLAIVSDNGSTDGTREILDEIAWSDGRLVIRDDPDVGYWQSAKTTQLAQTAHGLGFDWVIPCDADEWWYSTFGSLRAIIEQHDEAGFDIVKAELYDHVPTGADVYDANPYRRIGWRFGYPGRLPKVACRLRDDLTIEMGNHAATYERPARQRDDPALTLRHFTWRSEDQYVRKLRNGWAAYAATELPPTTGGHWRMFGPPDEPTWEERVRAHYQTWFYVPDPAVDRPELRLVYDPVVR